MTQPIPPAYLESGVSEPDASEPGGDAVPGVVLPTEDPTDPWYGIPPELLVADRPYDVDSAGGCG